MRSCTVERARPSFRAREAVGSRALARSRAISLVSVSRNEKPHPEPTSRTTTIRRNTLRFAGCKCKFRHIAVSRSAVVKAIVCPYLFRKENGHEKGSFGGRRQDRRGHHGVSVGLRRLSRHGGRSRRRLALAHAREERHP